MEVGIHVTEVTRMLTLYLKQPPQYMTSDITAQINNTKCTNVIKYIKMRSLDNIIV